MCAMLKEKTTIYLVTEVKILKLYTLFPSLLFSVFSAFFGGEKHTIYLVTDVKILKLYTTFPLFIIFSV